MTSNKFTPQKARGQTATENSASEPAASVKTISAADLARKRFEAQRERLKRSGARDGDKLWAPEVPGFVTRWAVDQNGRLDELRNKGYFNADTKDFPDLKGVISSTDEGSQVSFLVTGKDGKPTRQYLMLCADDIFAQRQADQEARRVRIEETISQAKGDKGLGHERGSGGKSVMYAPDNSAFDV